MPRSGFQCDPAEKEKTLATPRDLAGVMSQFSVKAQGLASRPPLLHGAHASASKCIVQCAGAWGKASPFYKESFEMHL